MATSPNSSAFQRSQLRQLNHPSIFCQSLDMGVCFQRNGCNSIGHPHQFLFVEMAWIKTRFLKLLYASILSFTGGTLDLARAPRKVSGLLFSQSSNGFLPSFDLQTCLGGHCFWGATAAALKKRHCLAPIVSSVGVPLKQLTGCASGAPFVGLPSATSPTLDGGHG